MVLDVLAETILLFQVDAPVSMKVFVNMNEVFETLVKEDLEPLTSKIMAGLLLDCDFLIIVDILVTLVLDFAIPELKIWREQTVEINKLVDNENVIQENKETIHCNDDVMKNYLS